MPSTPGYTSGRCASAAVSTAAKTTAVRMASTNGHLRLAPLAAIRVRLHDEALPTTCKSKQAEYQTAEKPPSDLPGFIARTTPPYEELRHCGQRTDGDSGCRTRRRPDGRRRRQPGLRRDATRRRAGGGGEGGGKGTRV